MMNSKLVIIGTATMLPVLSMFQSLTRFSAPWCTLKSAWIEGTGLRESFRFRPVVGGREYPDTDSSGPTRECDTGESDLGLFTFELRGSKDGASGVCLRTFAPSCFSKDGRASGIELSVVWVLCSMVIDWRLIAGVP